MRTGTQENKCAKTIFLDRDGTINEEVNYLYQPEDLTILDGVPEAIAMLNHAGFRVVVITNQAGVARGYYQEADVEKLHEHLNRELEKQGAHIDAFYYCPHHPEHGIGKYKVECSCRKPGTGLFLQAEGDFPVDKGHSYMVGDKLIDVEAGHNYGVASILVGTGYGEMVYEETKDQKTEYDYYSCTLKEAAKLILKLEEESEMEKLNYLKELTERYPTLAQIEDEIQKAYEILADCFAGGGKLLIAGNGGSCADAEHIVGELMKGFVKKREVNGEFKKKLIEADPERGPKLAEKLQCGLPAIALTGHNGLSTAFINDVDGEMVFAQQTLGYGKPGDVYLGISTSGNSKNVMYGVTVARAKGMKIISLTGRDGGLLKAVSDVAIVVPETETFKIQELHLPVYHAICLMLEEHFF